MLFLSVRYRYCLILLAKVECLLRRNQASKQLFHVEQSMSIFRLCSTWNMHQFAALRIPCTFAKVSGRRFF